MNTTNAKPESTHVTDAVVVDTLEDTWCKEIATWLDTIEDDANRVEWTDDERERRSAHERIDDAIIAIRHILSEIRVNVSVAQNVREPTEEDRARAREHLAAEGIEVPS